MHSSLSFALAVLCCLLLHVSGQEVVNVLITQIITVPFATYSGSVSAYDTALKGTVAGTLGVATTDVTAYSVVVDPASSSNIKVAYTISVTNLVNTYVQIYTQLTEEIADGTFNNLLHIFAAANSATGMATSTAGAYTIISQVPTASPTAAPTAAPTEYSAEQFGWQVTHFWIYSVIIGSFVGAFVLYQAAWGIVYLLDWLNERQKKHVEELADQVDKANAKLTKKFVKHHDSPSPHASRMRENFEKQFGYAPKGGGIVKKDKDEEGITLTSGADRSGAKPFAHSPKNKDLPDPHHGDSKDLETGASHDDHGHTPPRSPTHSQYKGNSNKRLDLSAHARTPVAPPKPQAAGAAFGTPTTDGVEAGKANRLKSNDKYGGGRDRKKFGFAD